jgi:hypothetical protein
VIGNANLNALSEDDWRCELLSSTYSGNKTQQCKSIYAAFGALLSRVISKTAHITFLLPYEARLKISCDSLG